MRRLLAATLTLGILTAALPVYADPVFYTNNLAAQLQQGQQTNAAGQTRVLQGIPAIARAFAPVAGVKWQDFANVLAGICAVESNCNPTYPHYVGSGQYSQYQGLFQMNTYEVTKAQAALAQMLPQMQAAAANDPDQQKAFDFVKKAIDAARSSSGDLRFLPEYGVILGAAKHIQIQKQLAQQYPDAVHQAAGHMVAQFSGITEAKILAGQFNAPVNGTIGNANTELGALAANKVSGTTVDGAIQSAGATYGNKMLAMMQKMSQVTNGLTTVPDNIQPFTAPPYQAGTSPQLNQSYGGVSTLMEQGYMRPTPAPPFTPTSPPSTSNIPAATTAVPAQTSAVQATSTNPVFSTPNSVALIIAQPQTVSRGNTLLVAWSSVGMSGSAPCQVTEGSVIIGTNNASYVRLPTNTLSVGTLTITLTCTTATGSQFVQSVPVTIQ